MNARRLLVASLFALAALVGGSGCNITAAPGRCVGCCYDNCIIPYASRAPGLRRVSAEVRAPGPGAEAMAY